MPIASSMRMGAVVAMLLLALPMVVRAEVRIIIRHASQLTDDRAVRLLTDAYRLVSTARVIYAQCGEKLALSESQQQYVAKQFDATSTAYMQAFDAAFRARTGAASPKAMVDEYYQYLLAIHTAAANNAALSVKNNGCAHPEIRDVVKYYDQLQKLDAEKAPAAPASEPGAAPVAAPATATTTTPPQ